MKAALPDWSRKYRAALRRHLSGGGEASLQRAYALGRKALEGGIGVVDVAAVYGQSLPVLLRAPSRKRRDSQLQAMNSFLVESLAPFEMTQRGYQDAIAALRQLNETLEGEARRIAHSLHDESGQLLTVVHIALEDLARRLPPDVQDGVEDLRARFHEVEEQLRRLSHEIRPPMMDDLGLLPSLHFLADRVKQRSGLHISIEGKLPRRPPPSIEIALYRSVQEGFTNVLKHARASRVRVSLSQDARANMIRCSVLDDGVGCDRPNGAPKSRRGLGLLGIQERVQALGGDLQIETSRGHGTRLLIQIPTGSV